MTVVTPSPPATPAPTATPKPTATPIPAGLITISSVSLARVEQSFVITVNVLNQGSTTVKELAFSLTWLDGNHPRGGEFGVNASDGHSLMDAGKTYQWTTTVPSTAVTGPVTATVVSSKTVDEVKWSAPAGTAPYVLE